MTISTNTTDRKALAKAIAEQLGTTAKYMGVPSCGYQIGDYILDKDGYLHGDDFAPIQDFLSQNGMYPEKEEAEIPEPTEEPIRTDADKMNISIPAQDVTVTQLKNLTFLLYAKQVIISRMVQGDTLTIPESLITELKENTPETPEDFTSLLDAYTAEGLTGFDFRDGKVSMTFPFDETQPSRWTTYANLLGKIFDAAKAATRVAPVQAIPTPENEKYLAHTWLQRLGYAGPDFKAERQVLLGHLSGFCAFANSGAAQRHKDKYAAIRREQRLSAQEEAVAEVFGEEVGQ